MASDDVFDEIERHRRSGAAFAVATVVRTADVTSAKAGAKAVVDGAGGIRGFLGGGCVQGAVRQAATEAIATGEVRLIRIKPAAAVLGLHDADGVELYKSGCPSGGTVDILIEPFRRPPALVVLGASPVAHSLLRQGRLMGYRLVHGAGADELMADAADELAPDFRLDAVVLDADDCIVVAAQGKHDMAALRAALAGPTRYVGMVASRRKAQTLVAKLRAEGLDEAALARLRSPAGLDLGSVDPAEIALSVMAEIVQLRRNRHRTAPALADAR